MEWYEFILIGCFIGLFVGTYVGASIWMRYGDSIELYFYRKEYSGKFPEYCGHCGGSLEECDDGR